MEGNGINISGKRPENGGTRWENVDIWSESVVNNAVNVLF